MTHIVNMNINVGAVFVCLTPDVIIQAKKTNAMLPPNIYPNIDVSLSTTAFDESVS